MHALVLACQGQGLADGGTHVAARATGAQQQQAFAAGAAAPAEVALQRGDQPLVSGQRQCGQGLGGVGQAQHGQRQTGLGQCAHRFLRRFPVGKENGVELLARRQLAHAHCRLGDDAQASLGAEQHFAQVGTGRRGRVGGDVPGADRSLHVRAGQQLLDAAIAQRLLAAGARSHPAAQAGVFERLREVAQGIALGPQLRFQVGPEHAGAEGGELRAAVQVLQLRQPRQADGEDGRGAAQGVDVAGHAGAAAIGNHLRAAVAGVVEQCAHLVAAVHKGHAVGDAVEHAVAQRQPVGQALAAAVAHPGGGVRLHQRVRRQAARRYLRANLLQRGVLRRRRCAQALLQKPGATRRQRQAYLGVPPSIPAFHSHSLCVRCRCPCEACVVHTNSL